MTEASLFNLNSPEVAAPAESPPAQSSTGDSDVLGTFAHPGSLSLSLYRKYRPQTFDSDDLFGQDHIVNTLRNAIALDRIAHAYLFCGPRGTGKTTTARLLSKAVNCLDPDARNRPCNRCSACDVINRNATTDVIEIDAASNRGIDDIRDLRERVKYAPTQLKTKFYIIDEAHQITGAAANAFLKTLEEPPAHTKFVLATTDPEELLQTIVSRCQRFDFRRINPEAMTACLEKVSTLERIAIDDEAIQIIVRHATGSLRDALGLLDQMAVYRDNDEVNEDRVTATTVRTVLGVSRNERVETLVASLADRDASAGLIAINQAADAGDDVRQLGRQLVAYLRVLLLERAGGSADADEIAKNLAARFSLLELSDLARLFSDIDYKVKHAMIAQLPLEIAIVEGANRRSHQPTESMATRSELTPEIQKSPARSPRAPEPALRAEPPADAPPRPSLRERVRDQAPPAKSIDEKPLGSGSESTSATPTKERPAGSPNVPSRPASSAKPEAGVSSSSLAEGGTLSLEVIVDLWSKIRADVKSVNRRIEALLQQVDPVTIDENVIVLTSPYEFHRNRVNSDEVRQVIEEVISRLVQRRVQISCVTREEASALVGSVSQTALTSAESPSSTGLGATALQGAAPSIPQRPDSDAANAPGDATKPVSSEAPSDDLADSPSTVSTLEDDERRIQAVKNIFDAEESDD